jgi:hypothetical protein
MFRAISSRGDVGEKPFDDTAPRCYTLATLLLGGNNNE